jgi:general secretion pathway protein C
MVKRYVSRGVTFGVWLVVAACAAYWALKVFVQAPQLPATTRTVADAQALRGDLAVVLGRTAEVPVDTPVVAVSSRFKLIGVLAPPSSKAADEGLALIAIDGKPPKAYRVGAEVDGDLVLQRVRTRGADLGGRDVETASVALEVPPLPPPAVGRPGGTLPTMNAPRPLPMPAAMPAPRPRPAPMPVSPDPVGEDDDAGLVDQDSPDPPPGQPQLAPGLETQ